MSLSDEFKPDIRIFPKAEDMAANAAALAANLLKAKLASEETVRVIAATGQSQIAFLHHLMSDRQIDWQRIELFHLDEYVGLTSDHPASFVRYIRERIIEPTDIKRYHLLDGAGDITKVMAEAGAAITERAVAFAFVGIGENGHLAFNDPPADFDTDLPYMQVKLDRACRQQQVNEGWFPKLDDVPQYAITMSVRQILKAEKIICCVPGERKAAAVRSTFAGTISPFVPATALRSHPGVTVFLDKASASLLPVE